MTWLRACVVAYVLGSVPAQAFVRTSDPISGACLFWTSREITWWLNDQGSNDVPFDTLPPVQAAVERSFQTWQDVDCSDLSFNFGGTTPRVDVGFDPGRSDNQNLIIWREQTCDAAVPEGDGCLEDGSCPDVYNCWDHGDGVIALTTTSYNRNTGEIVDADIELNGAADASGREFKFTATENTRPMCTPSSAPDSVCVSTDVQNTVTHEIGHLFGLSHSPDSTATMFASAAIGETGKRTLAQDDIDGLCAIYPSDERGQTCAGGSASVGNPQGNGNNESGCGGCRQGDVVGIALLLVLLLRLRALGSMLSRGARSSAG